MKGEKKLKKKNPQLYIDISVCLCAFFPATYLPVGQSSYQLLQASLAGAGELSQGLSCLPQSFWAGPLRSCDPACLPGGLEIQAFWIEIIKGPALRDRIDLLLTSSSSSIFFLQWDIDDGNLKPTKWPRMWICSSENVNFDKVLEFSGLNFFIFKKETSNSYLIRLLWGLNEEIGIKPLYPCLILLLNFFFSSF